MIDRIIDMNKETYNLQQQVYNYRDQINTLSRNIDPIQYLNTINWTPTAMRRETEILCQYPIEKLDHTYMENLSPAWKYVLSNKNTTIDNIEIKKIHDILIANTPISESGSFRTESARLRGIPVNIPDSYLKILEKLSDILYRVNNTYKENATNTAFEAHYDLIVTQPFNDYNKRLARIIMNWILYKWGYRPVIFDQPQDKTLYLDAIIEKANGNDDFYNKYMYTSMINTQQRIIKMLEDKLQYRK